MYLDFIRETNFMIQAKTNPPILANLPFEIYSFSSMEHERANQYAQLHQYSCYAFIWLSEGMGKCTINGEVLDMRNNKIFCVAPGQAHRIETTGNTQGYVILFNESFLYLDEHAFDPFYHEGLFRIFSASGGLDVQYSLLRDLNDISAKMAIEFNNRFRFRSEMLSRYFKIFLTYLTRESEHILQFTVQTREVAWVQMFMELLEQKYKTIKKVSGYAVDMGISPNYLNEIVKRVTGYTASHHIQQRIILEAKRQAVYSNTCMKEIAYNLGFSDTAHFSKRFKSITGVKFSSFKKEKFSFLALKGSAVGSAMGSSVGSVAAM
jgi:AraC family transcriptional activator of pobA